MAATANVRIKRLGQRRRRIDWSLKRPVRTWVARTKRKVIVGAIALAVLAGVIAGAIGLLG